MPTKRERQDLNEALLQAGESRINVLDREEAIRLLKEEMVRRS